jgi:hypothetical protein
MDAEQRERQRLAKLRKAQIAARDPGSSKIKGYDWAKHAAKPKPKQKPFLIDFFDILPNRWKGALLGFGFGAIIALFLWFLLPDEWKALLIIPLLVGAVVGMVVGKVMQNDVLR